MKESRLLDARTDRHSTMKKLLASVLFSMVTASFVHAGSLTYSGDTTEAPTWYRPENNSHPPSIRYDVNPRYSVFSFEGVEPFPSHPPLKKYQRIGQNDFLFMQAGLL